MPEYEYEHEYEHEIGRRVLLVGKGFAEDVALAAALDAGAAAAQLADGAFSRPPEPSNTYRC
jgi:hypothetical protein